MKAIIHAINDDNVPGLTHLLGSLNSYDVNQPNKVGTTDMSHRTLWNQTRSPLSPLANPSDVSTETADWSGVKGNHLSQRPPAQPLSEDELLVMIKRNKRDFVQPVIV